MRQRHSEIAVVFEPGCWGSLSEKLFRLTWAHLYVPLFQQYILTKKPSKSFISTQIPASTLVLRHSPSGPSHPAASVVLCLQSMAWCCQGHSWAGMAMPLRTLRWQGGSSYRSGVIHKFSLKRKEEFWIPNEIRPFYYVILNVWLFLWCNKKS